jgi:hypothetical protein
VPHRTSSPVHQEGRGFSFWTIPRHKSRKAGNATCRTTTGALPMTSPSPYRLDNRYSAGDTENGGEEQVIATQRKTKTKAREQGKRDQLLQAWRHIHTASNLRGAQHKAPRATGLEGRPGDLPHAPAPRGAHDRHDSYQKTERFAERGLFK